MFIIWKKIFYLYLNILRNKFSRILWFKLSVLLWKRSNFSTYLILKFKYFSTINTSKKSISSTLFVKFKYVDKNSWNFVFVSISTSKFSFKNNDFIAKIFCFLLFFVVRDFFLTIWEIFSFVRVFFLNAINNKM